MSEYGVEQDGPRRPISLTDEEMDGFLRELIDEGAGQDDPVPHLIATLDNVARRFEGYRALRATLDILRECAAEARGFAIQRLKELIAIISHRFLAPNVWLFLKEGDGIRAVVRRRTGRTDATLRLDEKGISTLVARTSEAYYTNDAPNDPHWRDTIPSKSSMAAPLRTHTGELVGVLCLESHQANAFSADFRDDLSAAVAELVPHVLVLKSLDRTDERWCPWHPRVHKWDLARVLRRICHAMAENIEGDTLDGIECALWSVDRDNDELYVYATSGYGTEYIEEETLGFDSFTGCVAECPARTVGQARPEAPHSTLWVPTATGWDAREGHQFHNQYKRTFMGLTEAMAIPLHLADSSGGAGEARYVLGIYAYGDQAAQALPSREELIQIAETLGDFISAYLEQRERLAAAYFAETLTAPPQARDFLPTIMREFGELLKLEGVRIYPDFGRVNELLSIDEHGSLRRLNRRDGNREYLMAVLKHPGAPVRVNNARSQRPDFLSSVLMRDAAGWLPWHDPDHHRFIDVGIEGFGMIRLVRSEQSKPFTPDDEQLFLRVATLCGHALRVWDPDPDLFRVMVLNN